MDIAARLHMTPRPHDDTRPRQLPGKAAFSERLVKTGHIRLWESTPKVTSYTLQTTSSTDALVGGADVGRSSEVLLADKEELRVVTTIITIRRVVTVDGLVAATNRILSRLELPFRLLPLASSSDVVACVHITEEALYQVACSDSSSFDHSDDRREADRASPRLKSVA